MLNRNIVLIILISFVGGLFVMNIRHQRHSLVHVHEETLAEIDSKVAVRDTIMNQNIEQLQKELIEIKAMLASHDAA